MADPVKVCVVTATRAEYGLLYPLLRLLEAAERYELQLVVTGTHLAEQYGHTIDEIHADGLPVTEQVDILAPGDDPAAVARTMANATGEFGEVFQRLQPDLLLVLGDRYEILAVVMAAHVARIPVAHLCGGDVTEGAIDDSIRHSISKFAHLHFVSNSESGRRVRQLGEEGARVHVVGETGVDNILNMEYTGRDQLADELNYSWRAYNLLVTFHPVTLGDRPSVEQLDDVLAGLAQLGDEFGIMMTFPNADAEGQAMLRRVQDFAIGRENVSVHASLGRQRYLSMLHHVDAVVGNSSSGVIEAPAMRTPTVNIGDRQKGRPQAESVVQADTAPDAIAAAVREAVNLDCSQVECPYGDGHAAGRIMTVLDSIDDYAALVHKRFVDHA